jgi:hypothetical protein
VADPMLRYPAVGTATGFFPNGLFSNCSNSFCVSSRFQKHEVIKIVPTIIYLYEDFVAPPVAALATGAD